MKRIDSAVHAYQERLRVFLKEELQTNGGSYQKWYDDLAPFREYITQTYVRLKLGKELYWYKGKKNKYGDVIDHHIVSYLSPLEVKRIGWNGELLRPYEQIEKTAKYLSGGGQIYKYCTSKQGLYLSTISM